MNKFLATDLDGTLLYPKSKTTYVCKENSEVIDLFNKQVIIVSGRNPRFIKGICDELNIPYTFVACNGGIIYHDGKTIFTKCIDQEVVKYIIEFINSNFKGYVIYIFDNKGNLHAMFDEEKLLTRELESAFGSYPKLLEIPNLDLTKISTLFNKKDSIVKLDLTLPLKEKQILYDHLITRFPNLSIALCNHSLEVTGDYINKGTSLKLLTTKLNIPDYNVYVIGDAGNDLSMFKFYPNSFLVKNKNNAHLQKDVKYPLDKFNNLKSFLEEDNARE